MNKRENWGAVGDDDDMQKKLGWSFIRICIKGQVSINMCDFDGNRNGNYLRGELVKRTEE